MEGECSRRGGGTRARRDEQALVVAGHYEGSLEMQDELFSELHMERKDNHASCNLKPGLWARFLLVYLLYGCPASTDGFANRSMSAKG